MTKKRFAIIFQRSLCNFVSFPPVFFTVAVVTFLPLKILQTIFSLFFQIKICVCRLAVGLRSAQSQM